MSSSRALAPVIAAVVALAASPQPAGAVRQEPAGDTTLDRVVARLGDLAPSFESGGVLAISVIRLGRDDAASYRGGETVKSASAVKALWVAAALARSGVEAVEPIAGSALYRSNNDAAGRALDLGGGIDTVNDFGHDLGLVDTNAYEWLFGGERRSSDYPGPLRGNNLTTADDLARFWAALGAGTALGPAETEALLEWSRGVKSSAEGSRLVARLPAQVAAATSFKMGWLPVGRSYELKEDETGWHGEPGGTVVTFIGGAVDAGAGLVPLPSGGSYAVAVVAYDGRTWRHMTGWVEYGSCVLYSVLARVPLACARTTDPRPIRERTAVPDGALERVRMRYGSVEVSGWAADPDAWWGPTRVAIAVDGIVVARAAAVPELPDDLFTPPFRRRLPIDLEPGSHEVCAVALNDGVGADTPIGCLTVTA